jgi:hydroxymethylpyrimidine pyrophosphatase-like HAD family hydrolase
MAKIKLVLDDIDGVIENFKKPEYPNQQDILPHRENLGRVKSIIGEHYKRGIVHGACTGRAFYSIEPVLRYIGINAPSVMEHGTEIWVPGEGSYRLVDSIFPELIGASNDLETWVSRLDDGPFFANIPKAKMIRRRSENKHILTYEFRGVTADEVYDVLEKRMPAEIIGHISTGKLRKVLSSSEVDGVPTGAIDVMPSISKADGVRQVLRSLGLRKDDAMGIEDSFHSGIPLLQEVGHVACPSNAQEKLKEYVTKRGGYIASSPHTDGWIEAMRAVVG